MTNRPVEGLDIWGVVGVALLVSLYVLGCGSDAPAGPPDADAPTPVATNLSLSPIVLSFSWLGATEQLTATVRDENGAAISAASVTWVSSASTVASVSSTGLVTAEADGTATITATSGSANETASVNVQRVAASITLSPTSLSFSSVGETQQLAATLRDQNGTTMSGESVAWASSASTVASVSSTGVVTALAVGLTTITATFRKTVGSAEVSVGPIGPSASVVITSGPSVVRQGDVARYTAETQDTGGSQIVDPAFAWSLRPASAGLIAENGQFVGYTPGSAWVVATASGVGDSVAVTITARGLSGAFSVLGHREVLSHFSSHIFVHGAFAYTGTVSGGDRLLVWDISDPANPTLTDSVVVGGSSVHDVMVRADGAIAAITNTGGDKGIILLDLSDPAHPTVITRLTEGLETSTHNLWIDGNYIYVAANNFGVVDRNGLVVVDITNLQNPAVVASYGLGSPGGRFGLAAHDMHVRDGLAVVSNYEAGLIILDVGGGGWGGSPANAIELSRTSTPTGYAHNAWYWPATGYVFMADETLANGITPPIIYVMDARQPSSPKMVATYDIPGDEPHNFWLDEDRGILYVAWWGHGVQAIDVTGTLMGQLDLQGRHIAGLAYAPGDCMTGGSTGTGTCAFSLQGQDGLIYVSDEKSGLWILELQP